MPSYDVNEKIEYYETNRINFKIRKMKWHNNAVGVNIFGQVHFYTFNLRKNIYAYIIILELRVKK